MNKLKELEEKICTLALELEAMKAAAAQDEEWPKDNDLFWCAQLNGEVTEYLWHSDRTDDNCTITGNVHRTKKEAEAYRDWLTNPRTQARRRVEMCEGFDPIGSTHIYFEGDRVLTCSMCCNYSGLSFSTKKQAIDCIDLLGEDVIKLALGVQS